MNSGPHGCGSTSRERHFLQGGLLMWEHVHGGVVSHHLLHRADLPAISNSWGVVLLPALTWFLTGRIQRRMALHSGGTESTTALSVVVWFVGALMCGISLAVAFTRHEEALASSLFLGQVLLALALPVYRAECVLGFVLGMTFTFGAVLPTAVGSLLAALSAVVHLGVRPVLARLRTRVRGR